jgi:hypothetical protein
MNAGNQLPPRLNQPQTNTGRIGLGLSLVAPMTIALMVLLHPG